MRKTVIIQGFVALALVMLTLQFVPVPALNEVRRLDEADVEPTLQEWFDMNGYAINATADELGIETFEAGYYQIAILDEIAGYAPSNNLSWYLTSSSELHLIFLGDNTTGDTTVFVATETFGLCLGTPDGLFYGEPNHQLFYTETSRNPDGFDHSLVFANPNPPGGFIIVWEDLWEGGDKDFQDIILAMLVPVIRAKVCICPHTLNLKSRGRWITCFIMLPKEYDVEDIDISTIRLNGTVPTELKPSAVFRLKCVGVKILMVKFSRADAIELIKSVIGTGRCASRCLKVTLTVTGTLYSGQPFEGSTRIRVIHFSRCRD